MVNQVEIRVAQSPADFITAKHLILQYVNWLSMDLSFQNFDKEIETLPVTYGHPDGRLFLAFRNEDAVGIAGIKRFNETDCEVKRMFVQPESRGFKIGQLLLTKCMDAAKELRYVTIKLDTAAYMRSAIRLYTDNGFKQIDAYRYNPHEEARYFELDL
jgi:GNAT superfamily N-acetyltransferase